MLSKPIVVGLSLALAACATAAPERPLHGVPLAALDRTADPCNDFYEFANGHWRADNPLPAGKNRWGPRDAAREATKGRMHDLLETLAARQDWPKGSAEQLVADQYASCMNEAAIDVAGLAPLSPLLAELNSINDAAGVQRGIRRLHDLGIGVGFTLTGAEDNAEPHNYVANFGAGNLGLPDRDSYLKPDAKTADARARYRAHVATVLKLGGMPEVQAAQGADAILALEARLAEASLDATAAADPAATDHKMTFAQLQALAPAFDFGLYFDEAKLSRADLNVAEPKLLQELDRQLRDAPVATWKLYLTWQLLDAASADLSQPFARESFDFKEQYLNGASAPKPRAARCAEAVENLLPEPLGKTFSARYFPPEAKAKVREMARNMFVALQEVAARQTWMTPETKQKALAKLATYNVQIGYPDQWKDTSGLSIHRDNHWTNVAAARRYLVDDTRKQIGKPTDLSLWQLPPSSTFAYIDLQLNEMVLPEGFLQPPAYRPDATDAVNYGYFGVALAHDLTHSIDLSGSELDLLGRPKGWWTEADRTSFAKRTQCVSDQFEASFVEPGVHFQGKQILSEAVGDLAGVRLAYLAMETSMEKNPIPTIDGFTPEQQFFIAFGQARAETIKPETQRALIKSDPHPFGKFRVDNVLANTPEFQQAFACKEGSAMVRSKEVRCEVW